MKKELGFTLLELMVAVTILILIVSPSIPSFKDMLDNKKLTVVGPIFEKTIRLARSQARSESRNVTITPIGEEGDWSEGWEIHRTLLDDEDRETLIRKFEALPGNPNFTSEQFNADNPITVIPTGQITTIGEFKLSLKNCSDNVLIVYELLLSGHLKRSETTCS